MVPGTWIKTIYIEPGSPSHNGWIESFHARLRDESLDRKPGKLIDDLVVGVFAQRVDIARYWNVFQINNSFP